MAALYFDATGLAYSFDDGHIAVRTVHSVKHVPTHQSSITRHGKVALSVKYVAAHLSSITTVPSGTDCQICHELRHTLRHHVKSRDIVPVGVSRLFVSWRPNSCLLTFEHHATLQVLQRIRFHLLAFHEPDPGIALIRVD